MKVNISPICQKRLKGDIRALEKEPLEYAHAIPDPDNMLTWYFILKGPEDSHYRGGYFLGKIQHSPEYPFKPPSFYMLTPSGRFHLNQKICLSNSDYHTDQWTPMWNVRNLIIGFLSIFLDDGEETRGIGRIVDTKENRLRYAKDSIAFNIKNYPKIWSMFSDFVDKKD